MSANLDVAISIIVRGDPFSDSDLIKMSWLDYAEIFFKIKLYSVLKTCQSIENTKCEFFY